MCRRIREEKEVASAYQKMYGYLQDDSFSV